MREEQVKWWEDMMQRYDTDKEGVRKIMRARQKKSRENYSGNGGFRSMSAEKRKRISDMGHQKRWGKEWQNPKTQN